MTKISVQTEDFDIAAEMTKRFAAKGKPLWTVRKTAAHQDRTFTNERDPVFQGTVMVLIDGETSGPAEAMAAALKRLTADGGLRAKMAAAAGRRSELFAWPAIADQYEAAYEEARGRGRKR